MLEMHYRRDVRSLLSLPEDLPEPVTSDSTDEFSDSSQVVAAGKRKKKTARQQAGRHKDSEQRRVMTKMHEDRGDQSHLDRCNRQADWKCPCAETHFGRCDGCHQQDHQ